MTEAGHGSPALVIFSVSEAFFLRSLGNVNEFSFRSLI